MLLYDAGRDLLAAPAFDGVLRLVIEAIAVAVAVGYCLRRARSGRPGGDRAEGR